MTDKLMFPEALAMASKAHGQDRDKGGELYILHPLTVALEFTDDVDRSIAVLHDTVEDTSLTLVTIQRRLGHEVANGVDYMSRRDGEKYSDFVRRCALHPRSRRIKLRDIAHNRRPDRYQPSLSGLKGRYIKAQAFLVDVMKDGSPEDIEFLYKFGYIGYDEYKELGGVI